MFIGGLQSEGREGIAKSDGKLKQRTAAALTGKAKYKFSQVEHNDSTHS